MDKWSNLHQMFKEELRDLMVKHAKDDTLRANIERAIIQLIGSSNTSITFHLFQQWACEGKLLMHHSNIVRMNLRLTATANAILDAIRVYY